ncbi:MAG: hydroxyethylthiazole kinase [Lachnospiraceae bacterium]|nr:hydroxyethylthiazole kinase [Lachnospiraceae bacterium]
MNLGIYADAVRARRPLIHSITNYVTAADCANLLLGCGARPMMADDPAEVAEITARSSGAVLNLGTPSERSIASLLSVHRTALANRIPDVFDPVGVGSSEFRLRAAASVLAVGAPTVIRGNLTEIRTVGTIVCGESAACGDGRTVGKATSESRERDAAGVDAARADHPDTSELPGIADLAKRIARLTGSIIVITGEADIVADGSKACFVRNGRPEMALVTGTGCQLSSLIAAYVASSPAEAFDACAAAVAAMGVAGEIAAERMSPPDGNASYGRYLLDAVSRMSGGLLDERAVVEFV